MRKLKLLSLLMLICFSVGTLWAADVTTTYVFQDRDWKAKIGDVDANWTVGTRAAGFTAGQGTQITTSADGANATSPTSFTNVSQIVIQYCTNSTKGAGTIKVQVGSGEEQSFAVTKPASGGTTLKSTTFNFSPTESGSVKLTVNCTTNSVYIYSIAITETSDGGGGGDKTTITDEQLAWSAANAEVTMGAENTFPTLTNSLDLDVNYQSTDETVATITSGGAISLLKAGTTTIKAIYSGDETYNAKTVSYALTVKPAPLTPIPGGVIDVLTSAAFSATSTTYTAFENKQATNLDHSDAVYIGKTARGGSSGSYYIQINSISSGNAGREIATTTSGGIVKRVEVDWGGSNTVDRYVMVYGSNEAYTGSETAKVGTELGKLIYTAGSTTEYIDIDGSYQYIQITANGAMYVNEIRITWVPSIKYAVNIIAPTGGTLVVKDGDDAITSGDTFVEGKTLTVEATPDGSHTGGTIVVKNGSDEDVTASVLSGTTLTVPAYAITVSATFEEKACTKLGTPSVSVTDKTYSGAKLTWSAISNADKYIVYIYNNDDSELEHNDAVAATEYTISETLAASTTYKYSVQAISDTPDDYCPSDLANGNFTTEAAPAATLTLYELGESHNLTGDHSIGEKVALPSTATECSKTFVGWSENESCAIAPEYAPGAEYTLVSASQTLYAVYAEEITPGAITYVKTALADIASGSEVVITEKKSDKIWAATNDKGTSAAPVAVVVTEDEGVLSTEATNIFWTIIKDGDNFSLTAKGGTNKLYCTATNNGVRVGTNTNNLFSIVDNYLYNNATSRYIGVQGEADWRCYTSINSTITGQTLAFYKKTIGEGTYDNYSTECTENAETPTITPDGSADYYTTAQNVTITAEEGATIYYTTDGSTPTTGSTQYTEAISLSARGEYTIKAIAVKAGKANSNVAEAVIKINLPFANLAELVDADIASGSEVTVTFANEVITGDQTISGTKRAGVMLTTKAANDVEIEIFYNKGTTVVPAGWLIGGKLSATSMTFTWTLYNSQWELVPLGNDWTWDNGDLTYVAPKAVSSVVVSGAPSKTSYVDGEKFNPDGLTVTVNYNDETSEVNPVGVTFALDPERLAIGNTSVEVVATYNTISSEAFEVTGLTVGEIQLKTVQEFITAGNADMRCYLEGVVSNIETGGKLKYGNFNLTDASGTIYVYGCLTSEGVAEQFGTLDVANGDKIKVLAEDYEYYNSKHEAKNVVFVSNKKAATMTFDDMALVFGEVQSLVPTSITLAANTDIVFSIKEGSDDCITINEFNDVEAKSVEGTATVIATLSETEDYMGTSVEFNITVTAPDLRKIAIGSAFTAINGDLTPADINFAAYQGDGTNAPVLRASDNPVTIRLYKPATGKSTGGYLTITALPGCKIDQVQITFVGNADASYSIDDAEFSTTKYITGKTELLTPAGLDAQSVSIVNLKSGSIDISAIKVWYTGEPLPLPEISYSPSIQSIEVGGAWSAPTLNNPNGVTIASYASDNEEVATVTGEGEISLKSGVTGTAHITAHFDGNETYRAADAIYTIIVLSEADALLANSTWIRVDNAATLRAGMQVIVAQYGEGDVKAMGAQNSNNRAAVSATVSGNVLSPETGTQILTLVDAGEGKFSFLTTGGYLYAASSSSNNLKEEVEKDDNGNADWEISISKGVATIIAQGDKTHNWMRYNSGSSLFSCYESGQEDIALYVKADDYNRDVTAGRYGTICLPKGGVMEGATLYEVAYFDGAASKIFFDEIVNGTMEPGMPYIFLSNAPASKLGVIYSDEEPAVSAKNNNGLYGSFTQELLAKDDGNYIMLNNQYLFVNSDEVYVGANRAYIRLEDVPTTATPLAPGRRRISMGVANEQVATGIDNLNADEAPMKMMIDGQLFILRGEKLYDATGRLVK